MSLDRAPVEGEDVSLEGADDGGEAVPGISLLIEEGIAALLDRVVVLECFAFGSDGDDAVL